MIASATGHEMKLPRFTSRSKFDGLSKQDEKVFAEASELALLRLEQCIADLRVSAPFSETQFGLVNFSRYENIRTCARAAQAEKQPILNLAVGTCIVCEAILVPSEGNPNEGIYILSNRRYSPAAL